MFVVTNLSARLIVVYESRLKAWDTVRFRKHTVFKIYTTKKDFSDILILGKLDGTIKKEKWFEIEFVAHIVFANPESIILVTTSYKIWAVRMVKSLLGKHINHSSLIRIVSLP